MAVTLCLREEAREGGSGGGGDASLFPLTREETRLFLSGLQKKNKMGSHTEQTV